MDAIKTLAARGRPGPQRVLEDRPRLFTHLVTYYEAFQRLSSCRAHGPGGVGQIPWTAVDAYAYRYEIEGDDFDRLTHFIEVLDGVYLAHTSKAGTTGGKGKGPGKSWAPTTPP